MRPSRSSQALESIIRDLAATGDGATYFAERVWGAVCVMILRGVMSLWGAVLRILRFWMGRG